MEYTPEENTQELVENLEHLRKNKKITEEWIEKNKKIIRKYRCFFYDFTKCVADYLPETEEINNKLSECEELCRYIDTTFDVNAYRRFLENMYFILETLEKEEEFTGLISQIKI